MLTLMPSGARSVFEEPSLKGIVPLAVGDRALPEIPEPPSD